MKLHVIECAGHPRDMGGQQGRACQPAVRAAVVRAGLTASRGRWPRLSPFTSGAVRGGGAAREIIRHYTHLSERIDGLARGSGVSTDSLLDLHVRCATGGLGAEPLVSPTFTLVAADLDGEAGLSVVRGLVDSSPYDSEWLVRRSEPEVGFASLEVTLPWLATAVAGVNACGLVVSWVPDPDPAGGVPHAPPFVLLVQECLQRFEGVDAAADWCMSRAAWGHGSVVLADATGAATRVDASGRDRRRVASDVRPLALGAPARPVEDLLEAARHEGRLDEKSVAAAEPQGAFVRLVAGDRALQLKRVESPVQEAVLRL